METRNEWDTVKKEYILYKGKKWRQNKKINNRN